MILAAHQPQFMPWLGYFDKMLRCDLFVLLDNVQFKKNEWQNRNRVLMNGAPSWLTVPVLHHFGQNINEVRINDAGDWKSRHLKTLKQCYAKTPFFAEMYEQALQLYGPERRLLHEINVDSIELLKENLGIGTRTVLSSTLKLEGVATARLVDLCAKTGADTYLAGAGGHDYMDLELFKKAGIKVIFQEYKHPEYAQGGKTFVPYLSALDLLFHCGPQKARSYFTQ